MAASSLMATILGAAERARAAGRDPLVVLDLDGTLYDNTPRTLRILQEFAHLHAVGHPGLYERLDTLARSAMAYRTGDTLRALGVTDEALIEQVQTFWFERFFTDAYVIHDLPNPGAVAFVRALYTAGLVPAYLTGRDAPNMLVGTVQALQRDGFPVGTVDTRIILKDRFSTPDEEYKASVVEHLRATGEVVAVFDNEPGLCNLFHEAFPAAACVLLDTSCAPGAPPLAPGLQRVADFRGLLP
ncbi:MAG: HAD family hydrolase [Deltaproteobacteria bacterium]|nr:HAD family hydrolase [Deltaproteobacteria bacterium]